MALSSQELDGKACEVISELRRQLHVARVKMLLRDDLQPASRGKRDAALRRRIINCSEAMILLKR